MLDSPLYYLEPRSASEYSLATVFKKREEVETVISNAVIIAFVCVIVIVTLTIINHFSSEARSTLTLLETVL
jgi:hypothetical protein|tara:strand:- start:10131 stop:10346 length:216 start_codon:yes stop_codon:yes gene_type:complete